MQRFVLEKQHHSYYRRFLPVGLMLLVMLLFLHSITTLSDGTRSRQKEALERALTHSIMYCYSVEGVYPESLEYIKEHYGLTYNEDLFYVDYRISGGNLMPDITIIEKED